VIFTKEIMMPKNKFVRYTLLARTENGLDYDISSHVPVGLDNRINHFLDELEEYWDEEELDPIEWEDEEDERSE